MDAQFVGLLIPLIVFLVAGGVAIALYYATREFWRKTLDLSRGARFLYVSFSVIILPLILGGWSDIVDASQILQGGVTADHAIPLSFLAVLLVVYLYLHGCWFDREEYGVVTRASEAGQIAELSCQKNYLVQLLENLRACIGEYDASLRRALPNVNNQGVPSKAALSDILRNNIRMVIEAVRQTYKALETVPKDHSLKILLLRANGDFLEHSESYDGTSWDCQKMICGTHRDHYFDLRKPNASAAVASVLTETIHILEDCERCHEKVDHPFWYFQNCISSQKSELGSMIIIPFATEDDCHFALCVTCSQRNAFLERHRWKAKTIQENVQARMRLLFSQFDFLSALSEESEGIRQEKERVEFENFDLHSEMRQLTERLARVENDREAKLAEATVELEGLKERNLHLQTDVDEIRHELEQAKEEVARMKEAAQAKTVRSSSRARKPPQT